MKTAVPLFIEEDSVEHLDFLSKQLSHQFNRTVSRSEVVEWLVRRMWKKVMKEQFAAKAKKDREIKADAIMAFKE